jgi:hypothetical protein
MAFTLRELEPSLPGGRGAGLAGRSDAGAGSWLTEAKNMVRDVVIGRPLALPELLTCQPFQSLHL